MLGLDPYTSPDEGRAPQWSLPSLRKLRKKLVKKLRPVYLKVPLLTGDVFNNVVSILEDSLPAIPFSHLDETDQLNLDRRDNIAEFLEEWFGQPIDWTLSDRIIQLFTGNVDTFRYGYKFQKWDMTKQSVWGLVRVSDIERLPIKGPKYYIEFTVEAGPGTGLVYSSARFGNALQQRLRDIGLPKWKHKLYPEMLHGMYYITWMTADNKQILNEHVQASSSVEKHNKSLMEMRLGPCIGGYMPLRKPCVPDCPFGEQACPQAWHKHTYSLKTAYVCRNMEEDLGRLSTHKGRMNKHGRGICINCIYRGYTEEYIRVKEDMQNTRSVKSRRED